jgi:hypothetical protein
MGEVLVRAFGYTVAARYLDNSEEMVRERYSHIEAGELIDIATEALDEIDSIGRDDSKIRNDGLSREKTGCVLYASLLYASSRAESD